MRAIKSYNLLFFFKVLSRYIVHSKQQQVGTKEKKGKLREIFRNTKSQDTVNMSSVWDDDTIKTLQMDA